MTARHPRFSALLLLCLLAGTRPMPDAPRAAPGSRPSGALDGTFGVNANGAATYTIDIAVPNGTNAVQPALSIGYDSQSTDGLLGVGFRLTGLSSISRCGASRKLDGYDGGVMFDAADRFCLDGQRLVKVAGTGAYGAAGSVYHSNIESWTKVTAEGACGSGPCSFVAWNKDGWKLEFGTTADSRAPVPGRAEIGAWQIARSTDLHGNAVDVSYRRSPRALQNLPVAIRYTTNAAAGVIASRRVELAYEPRTDVTPRYVGGIAFEQSERLRSIRTFVRDEPVFEYALAYAYSGSTGRTLLTSIAKCAGGACLPATAFDWQKASNGVVSPNTSGDGFLRSGWCAEASALVSWIDFNADGRTDVHCSTPAGTQRVLLSTGTELVSPNSTADGTLRTSWCAGEGFGARWLDFNGDARSDVACSGTDGSQRVLLSTGTALVSPNATLDGLLKTNWCAGTGSRAQWTNFNADGRADLACRTEDGVQRVLLSTGGGLASPNSSADGTVRAGWCRGSDAAVWWADFNGDRLADAHCSMRNGMQQVLLSDARTLVSPNSDAAGTVRTNWCAGHQIGATDFNGDGLLDSTCSSEAGSQWVLLATGKTLVSPNSSADGLVRASWCAGGDTWWSDFNGDGFADVQCSEPSGRQLVLVSIARTVRSPNSSADGVVRTNWCANGGTVWTDFNGDALSDAGCSDGGTQRALVHERGFPDLVTGITDGLGLRTTVEYAPLTERGVYQKTGEDAWPTLDVQSPMYVVKRYTLNDGRGATYRYAYRYFGARTDLEARQWLGFERVVMTDEATGRRNETTYLQRHPIAAYVSGTAVYDRSDVALARATFTPKVVETYPNVFQVLTEAEQSSTFTAGAPDYVNHKRSAFDRYGNPTLVADWNEGTRSNAVYHCFAYTNDERRWRLGYVTARKTSRTETSCAELSRWNAADDLEWGRTRHDDAMNVVEELAYDDRNEAWLKESRTYDRAGNTTSVTSPAGGTTNYEFDADLAYPRAEVLPPNAAGVRMRTGTEWSAAFGVLVSTTDPNGNTQRQVLDAFGRSIETYGPDPASPSGAATVRLAVTEYGSDAGGAFIRKRERHSWSDGLPENWSWSINYYDGMGRPFRLQQLAGDGAVVTVDTQYDEAGRDFRESYPYFAGGSPSFITTHYDLLNRPTLIVQPNGVKQRIEYLRGEQRVRTTDAWETHEARTTITESDARLNIVRVESADGGVSTAEYDALSRPVRATRPNGSVTTLEYDSLGHVTRTTDTDAGTATMKYAATGLLAQSTDGAGNVSTFAYDLLERLTRRSSTHPSQAQAIAFDYAYDDPAAANGRMQLTRVTGPRYQQEYAYTRYGAVGTEKLTLDGRTYFDSAAYDPAQREIERTFFDGSRLQSSWSMRGDLLTLDLQEGGNGPYVRYAEYTGYDAASQPLGVTYGNGLRSTYTYFPPAAGLMRLRNAAVLRGDAVVTSAAFTWNDHTQITRIERTRDAAPAGAGAETYGHNRLGWLERAAGGWGAETYAYDRSGNLTQRNDVAFTMKPASDRMAATSGGTSFEYDGAGNLTRRANPALDWRYDWNASAQLAAVRRNGAVVVRNLYDHSGQRLERADADGSVSRYITGDADLYESGGSILLTKTIRGANDTVVATITTPYSSGELEDVLARQRADLEPSMFDGGTLRGLARMAAARLSGWLLRAAEWGGVLLALALGAAMLRFRRTEWARRNPGFAAIAPLVMAAVALCVTAAPARAQLGPGRGDPAPGIRYFHSDQITSVILVTGPDGAEQTRVAYSPYGEIDEAHSSGPDDFRPKFTTKEWDHGAELYAFGSRYYDPRTARFLSPDPQDQFVSRYMYGVADPVDVIDRDGELAEIIALIVVGAIVGAYFGGVAANHDLNPLAWEWTSARTLAGVFAGAVLGAASGALGAVSGPAGIAAGIIGEGIIGGVEGAFFTALGGGSQQEIIASALIGAGLGALSGGLGAMAGAGAARASRFARRGAGEAETVASTGVRGGCPACRCSSFPAGTLVAGGDSTLRPIETLAAGDAVLAFDPGTAESVPSEVLGATMRETDALVAIEAGGETIEATPEHPFFVAGRGWVAAGELRAGDDLVTEDRGRVPVTARRDVHRRAAVHNLSVARARTYFVAKQRFLVHNFPCKRVSQFTPPLSVIRKGPAAKAQWVTKQAAIIAVWGDKPVWFKVLPGQGMVVDFRPFVYKTKQGRKAIVNLNKFKRGSSRSSHFDFADKIMAGRIANEPFNRTNPLKWEGGPIARVTWHHDYYYKRVMLVPTKVHEFFRHIGGFSRFFKE